MKTTKVVIDINAHVNNISCKVSPENGNSIATIDFDNLGYGTITAIKFIAKGYNSFGDLVPINGKDIFFLIIQDISIDINSQARNLKAILPNPDIRKLDLYESQICFADGSVVSCEGEDSREFELNEYEENGEDKEIYNALKNKFGNSIKYLPLQFSEGWICSCGRFNKTEKIKCSCCNNSKLDLQIYTSLEERTRVIEEYKKIQEERAEEQQKAEKVKAQEEKKKKIVKGIGALCALLFIVLIINSIILSGRTTYSSEEAMRTALQGTWTHYGSSGKGLWQIIIEGDGLGQIWDAGQSYNLRDITWNPSRGTFSVGGMKYIVTSSGQIKEDGYTYRRGGSISSSSTYSSSTTSYESYRTALVISGIRVYDNSSYTICTGTVTNNGTGTYDYVKVKGSFKDSSGSVLDTDWTYAVGAEGLAPGESTTFRLSIAKNSKVTDCSVSFMD